LEAHIIALTGVDCDLIYDALSHSLSVTTRFSDKVESRYQALRFIGDTLSTVVCKTAID
jgi:hypothetical protein